MENKLEYEKSKNLFIKLLLIITIGTVFFWVGAAVVSFFLGFIVEDKDVILTFIGIIATFVVISNYMQLSDIKKQINKDIDQLKFKIERVDLLIKKIVAFNVVRFEDFLINGRTIEAYDFFFENYSKELEEAVLNILWKYFGGLYIGKKKGKKETLIYKNKYEENLKKADFHNVSDAFKEYMTKAFLSNGETALYVCS